ncbi:zinc finger protein 846-like isoform X2 [Prorops nasuta]|uniref:zinc finger protein 846-like isoform X2 n=1 Tax=Prorops nasuta TaxID=863751 RepID=UPI0034CEADF4
MEASKEDAPSKNFEEIIHISGDECRICLKRCTEGCHLFPSGKELIEKLIAFATVQVEEGDGLPSVICISCQKLLHVSYNFQCQIQRTDTKLRKMLELKSTEHHMKHVSLVDSIIANVISDVNSVSNNEDNYLMQSSTEAFNINTNADHLRIQDVVMEDNRCSNLGIEKYDLNNQMNETNKISVDDNILWDKLKSSSNIEKVNKDSSTSMNHIIIDTNNKNDIKKELSLEENTAGLDECNRENYKNQENIILGCKNEIILNGINNNSHLSEETNDNCGDKPENNTSDEEEKPLISRTLRQKCSHCIKSFRTKVALERHMKIHKNKTKLRYVCYICDKQFSNIAKLKEHIFNSHDTSKNDDTVKDNEEYKSLNKHSQKVLREEDDTVRDKKQYKFSCKVCAKQFTYQKSFLTHAKNHPEYQLEHLKDDSSSSVKALSETKDSLRSNLQNNSNTRNFDSEEEDEDDSDLPMESLQCTECGKLFATKRNLKRHIWTHSGLKFNCSTCGKGFSRIDKLKDHEQSKHKEELFACSDDQDDDDPDNENNINENADTRKREKQNRPHKCSLCPKAFAQAQSLANHMERHKRVKDTQKRFLCEVCSKCFAQSGSLVAHMRTHTGVKPYVCNVCSRAFTKSTYLQLHLRTHSGEKPYICQYCSRAFARANTLARHITMHTGEAKYHCQICTKSFRRLTSLNEHTYTHTGQRPYACKICTKRYNNAGSLYAHTKKCINLFPKKINRRYHCWASNSNSTIYDSQCT